MLGKKRRSIIDWIQGRVDGAPLDMRTFLRERLNLHHARTCTWLYEHPCFKNWYHADTNTKICYQADAGAGKTMLSCVITRYLKDQGLKTAYFSYSFNDPYRRNAISAIRSLALQVLMQIDIIPDKVLSLYETEMSNYAFVLQDVDTAAAVLQTLLKHTSRIHVVIDGLDECVDGAIMSKNFTKIMSANTLGIVKWFLTSRKDEYAQLLARQVNTNNMIPDSKVIMEDIKIYLQDHLLAQGHIDKCIDRWTAASEGNFQYISIRLRTLKGIGLTCEEDIEEELKRFPMGLTGCYLRTLEKLALRSKHEQELAR